MQARKNLVIVPFGIIAMLFMSVANSAVISFNEFAQGTIIDDEYTNLGALFSSSSVNSAQIVDATGDASIPSSSVVSLPSGPNGLRILDSPDWDDKLIVEFVNPSDPTLFVFMTSVSFSYVSDDASAGSILAYDFSGNLIESAFSSVGGSSTDSIQQYETLAVSALQIWSVEIDGFADVIIDQITFDNVQAVPLPASIWLFGVALLGMLGIKKQSRHR